MRRLYPNPQEGVELLPSYDVARPRPASRPWIGLCMVASLDGSTVVGGEAEGNSRSLSNPIDQQLLLTLRSLADTLLVGATTVRREGYGPPRVPGQRLAVVSRAARFDFDLPLWTSGRAVLLLPEDAPAVPVPSIRAGRGDLDLVAAVAQLDADFVQAEGGASLNGLLAAGDLIDELNLSLSPLMVGGDGSRVTAHAPELVRRMRLAHVLEHDDFLFTRYVRYG
ncbi:MAG: dihydrofolate reductase family protein [Actinobacteria bacterium]|nr:dihydrofolate reductase family protein [Actinomycetota bacterium]